REKHHVFRGKTSDARHDSERAASYRFPRAEEAMFKPLVASVPVMALLAGAAVTEAGVPRDESARIRVRITAGRYVIVPVIVNGTGPYRFLLDTGATSTMIAPALAARLRLPAAGSAV